MLTEKVIPHLRLQEIHIGSVVILHRSDVSPVIPYFVAVNSLHILVTYQNITHKIVSVLLRALFDHFDQLAAAQHINAAGDSPGLGLKGLFLKFLNAVFLIHPHGAEPLDLHSRLHLPANYSYICLFLNMIFQHLIEIQLVHSVAGGDHHIGLMAVFQVGKILVDGVGSSSVPVAVVRRHRGRKHGQSSLFTSEIPPFGGIQMLVEASGIILGQHGHLLNM